MPERAAIRAEAERLCRHFESLGAHRAEADVLQPAGPLLDLYGEDIRARAFTSLDADQREVMLRPDFTLQVVEQHLREGAGEARYTYAGEVFRRQVDTSDRPVEFLQVGFEILGSEAPAAADAEVFATIAHLLAPLGLKAATGDLGLLRAAIQGLQTSRARKAALMRHLWRPRRFRALLERFSTARALSPARAALLADPDPLKDAGPRIGQRTAADVSARLAALRADAEGPPIAAGEVALIQDLLTLRETAPNVLSQLRDMAVDMPAIVPSVERFAARLGALDARGIDVQYLDYEGSYGRTTLEYYDGFVFGFFVDTAPGEPPVATGGRYDALTAALGAGRTVPAVGGVIRPALSLRAGGRS